MVTTVMNVCLIMNLSGLMAILGVRKNVHMVVRNVEMLHTVINVPLPCIVTGGVANATLVSIMQISIITVL